MVRPISWITSLPRWYNRHVTRGTTSHGELEIKWSLSVELATRVFVVNALELSSVAGMEKKRIIRTRKKHVNVLCDSRGTRYAWMFDLHVVNRSRLREASPARWIGGTRVFWKVPGVELPVEDRACSIANQRTEHGARSLPASSN